MESRNDLLNIRVRELEAMNSSQKIEFFKDLRSFCEELNVKSNNKITATQKMMSGINKITRHFDMEIIGKENVPKTNCLFIGNHSNTHDAFVTAEVLTRIGKPGSFLAAIEGLSAIELKLFKSARATMIDRTNKESTNNGLLDFSSKLLYGDTGFIFGESTWNLHPIKPMQNIKIGGAKVAAISRVPIVPIIYEYVEVPNMCSKEKQLYTKCVVQIGKPIYIDESQSLIEQTQLIQSTMENMRRQLWSDLKIYRESLDDIDPQLYVNHTWLKKFGTPLFTFDSESENKLLRSNDGTIPENEYFIDSDGIFKPGIIKK